jgi:hypothetical protein
MLLSEEKRTIFRHSHGIGGRDENIREEVDENAGFVYRKETVDLFDGSQLKSVFGENEEETVYEEDMVKKFMQMHEVKGVSSTVDIE